MHNLDFIGRENLLEADAIAERIQTNDPGSAALAAGREVLLRTYAYINSHQDFAIETTLAGSWTATVIRTALQERFFGPPSLHLCQ